MTRAVVNPRIPVSQHIHSEAGFPHSLAEPTTTAHSPLLWQPHDVKTAKFACVLSAAFIFASVWPWVGRRMRKTGNKTPRLVELVGSRGSQPARSISWNTTAATIWTRCYIRNDSPVEGNKICVITWLRRAWSMIHHYGIRCVLNSS